MSCTLARKLTWNIRSSPDAVVLDALGTTPALSTTTLRAAARAEGVGQRVHRGGFGQIDGQGVDLGAGGGCDLSLGLLTQAAARQDECAWLSQVLRDASAQAAAGAGDQHMCAIGRARSSRSMGSGWRKAVQDTRHGGAEDGSV